MNLLRKWSKLILSFKLFSQLMYKASAVLTVRPPFEGPGIESLEYKFEWGARYCYWVSCTKWGLLWQIWSGIIIHLIDLTQQRRDMKKKKNGLHISWFLNHNDGTAQSVLFRSRQSMKIDWDKSGRFAHKLCANCSWLSFLNKRIRKQFTRA